MSRFRSRLRGPALPTEDEVRPIISADLPRIRPEAHPRLSPGDAEALLLEEPGLSWWHPESGEFVLVTPWRHRSEIPSIHVLSAFRHEEALVSAASRAARDAGKAAFVVMDAFESRRRSFYDRNDLQQLESLITYEHRSPERILATRRPARLNWVRLELLPPPLLTSLLALDHAAFPWLWHNSALEFSHYVAMPFVELWGGFDGDQLLAYIALTHFPGWGHLDRIAVLPQAQGRGFGKEALQVAVSAMIEAGAGRVALSTQQTNRVSRSFYEGIGFVETPMMNYGVYGVVFDESVPVLLPQGALE